MAAPTPPRADLIFVSYRREDTAYPAGWLFDRLTEHYGRASVFKDIDSIGIGDDFVETITNAVGSCAVLLAVIGRRWLTATDEKGRRRLDEPGDFVRLEIETALERGIRVIPVLVEDARLPNAADLPDSLVALASRQALELSPNRFASDSAHLLQRLDTLLGTVSAPDQARGSLDSAGAADVRASEPAGGEPLSATAVSGPGRKPRPYQIAIMVLAVAIVVSAVVVVPKIIRHARTPLTHHHAASPVIQPPTWQFRTSTSVDGSPAVAAGTVYVADDNGVIYALNARDGHLIWADHTHSQIDSKPCLVGRELFVGNDAGDFYAINTSNGKKLWVTKFAGGIDSSPAVVNGVAYFGDGYDYVDAVSTADGHTVWRYQTAQTVQSSPVIYAGVVYIGSEDHFVYALTARSGTLVWKTATKAAVDSSPAIADGTVYIGSDDHKLYALNAQSGRQVWAGQTGGAITAQPFIYRGTVYIGSNDGALYAFAAGNGRRVWRVELGGIINSSPLVHDGVIYIGNAVSSASGSVYALTVRGQKLWSYQTSGDVQSSPAVDGGLVYIGSDNNEVIALKLLPGS
jgi:outer membrane protein assembly factor BamB